MSRATTPIMMTAASSMRDMTKPRASDSLTRLTTGKTATALPMQASALTKSRKQAHSTWVSWPGADDVPGVVQDRCRAGRGGMDAAKVSR